MKPTKKQIAIKECTSLKLKYFELKGTKISPTWAEDHIERLNKKTLNHINEVIKDTISDIDKVEKRNAERAYFMTDDGKREIKRLEEVHKKAFGDRVTLLNKIKVWFEALIKEEPELSGYTIRMDTHLICFTAPDKRNYFSIEMNFGGIGDTVVSNCSRHTLSLPLYDTDNEMNNHFISYGVFLNKFNNDVNIKKQFKDFYEELKALNIKIYEANLTMSKHYNNL